MEQLKAYLDDRATSADKFTARAGAQTVVPVLADTCAQIDGLLAKAQQVQALGTSEEAGIAELLVQKLGGMSREARRAHASALLIARESLQLVELEQRLQQKIAAPVTVTFQGEDAPKDSVGT